MKYLFSFFILFHSLIAEQKPNIIIIYSDDMGYNQLGVTGCSKYKKDAIDSIAKDGVLFTNGYVSGPVCAPSRAGLMTGRYQIRYGYESFTGPISTQIKNNVGVPTNEILLPKLLKKANYRTAHIGKWHLGHNSHFHPNKRGVDYFYGFLSGGHDYYEWDKDKQQKVPIGGGHFLENEKVISGKGYKTEGLTAKACEYIKENKDSPFYLMYAPFNVHSPFEVPEKYIPEGGTVIDGMVVALDVAVKDILATIDECGIRENTIVFFINDNGGTKKHKNGNLKGYKGSVYEGGVRVPFMVRWPARFSAGKIYNKPVIQLDVLPTAIAAAGVSLPSDREMDGVDLIPYLSGEKNTAPHKSLFWRHKKQTAIREGDWKLVVENKKKFLFNLKDDIGEKKNLSQAHPEMTTALSKKLTAWVKETQMKPAGSSK